MPRFFLLLIVGLKNKLTIAVSEKDCFTKPEEEDFAHA